jgi:hypothetical protein
VEKKCKNVGRERRRSIESGKKCKNVGRDRRRSDISGKKCKNVGRERRRSNISGKNRKMLEFRIGKKVIGCKVIKVRIRRRFLRTNDSRSWQ